MSVLIKGMEMPKHCRNCKFSYFTHGISMKCLFISEACKIKGRLSNCPLVAVPTPHGRLIDADKLTKNMRNYYPSIDYLCCSQHVVTKGDIDNAPTVIEAEHESEARKWARVGRDISKGLQEGIVSINSEVPE